MRVLTRAAITLTIAACGTAGVVSTAYAEKVVHNDQAGDVIVMTEDDEAGTATTEPAPTVEAGDVLRTVVDHRAKNLFVTARYADLQRGDEFQGHIISIVTNESVRRDAILVVDAEHPQGRLQFVRPNGRSVKCVGIERRIDYSLNTVRVKIPRSCLSAPRWVRVGLATFRGSQDGSTFLTWADDANRTGSIGETGPAFGVRVHRG
jgi:hypothetical protein